MNTKTETRTEIPSQDLTSSTVQAPSASPTKGDRRGLWVAIVGLVAVAGLAAAVAIEAFDSSSDAEAVTSASALQLVDPRLDADFHREVGQLSPKDNVPAEWDTDFHRVPGQASPKDPAATSEVDKDFQREANQVASQEEVKPYGSGLPHEAH